MFYHLLFCCLFFFATSLESRAMADTAYFKLNDFGLQPNTGEDATVLFREALRQISSKSKPGQPVVILFAPGRYDFFPDKAVKKELYISNHDQDNPKTIGLLFENWQQVTVDGAGSDLLFHGRMLPVVLQEVKNFHLKNLHIDFVLPQICQVTVLENDTTAGVITCHTAPWVEYAIEDSIFYNKGEGWKINPTSGIAFESQGKHLVYNTSDLRMPTRRVVEMSPGIIKAYGFKNAKLIPGTVLAMRSWQRPAPGIFLYHGFNVYFENVKVHYAEGMGLLAQVSENITLDGFDVSLRGKNDPRYFTTQADATHFSGCRGKIRSVNGLYEGMMDDAINVHGTYLKIIEQKNNRTVLAAYMHGQSYGFEWGRPGDEVQLVASKTMENTGPLNSIRSIKPVDKPTYHGAKQFEIVFAKPLGEEQKQIDNLGIENISWTPEVYFANNTIRNNRARGALFSTPRKTVVENNLFDHTSGSAILLCGDCNGWFETGACRSVLIKNNRFVNALTNLFQFTNAVISVYPEIPDIQAQKKYFHSGIVIEDNVFETFDNPLVYAKSVNGLVFRNNKVITNHAYPAFHWNKNMFFFERVINYRFSGNQFDRPASYKIE
ncbi:MAG: right-handed parallel beta-helix repeat-containing protein [Flavihumibacter sp.]